jgi:predicted nucleic acid-binding protein
MILVDTGYWLALASPNAALHQRARDWGELLDEEFIVPEYVLWETVNALSSPADRRKAHEIVGTVLNEDAYEFVSASPVLLEAGLQRHRERPDKHWSLTDCILFVVMEERGIRQALAYDRDFEQAGFEALLRRDP